MEYQYRSYNSRGTIRVAGEKVASNVTRGSSKWSYETPLKRIYPDPVRSWSFPGLFWWCVSLGAIGVVLGLLEFFHSADHPHEPNWFRYTFLVASLGLGVLAIFMRREEWVAFPTETDSIWIRYSRSGPDRERFDGFTTELCSRISKARANASV